jgi:membrane-associated protease RseP (regulator of RpoE activity)
VAQVYNQLTGPEHRVERGSIGIEFNAEENPAIARVYGVQGGITISNVLPGSPAERAGLKIGDTIVSVDGKAVKNGDELVADIANRKPGSKLTLGYYRNGKKDEAPVAVADRAKLFASGITVLDLTPEMADRNVPSSRLEFQKDLLAWAESLPDYGSELQRKLDELYPDDIPTSPSSRRLR